MTLDTIIAFSTYMEDTSLKAIHKTMLKTDITRFFTHQLLNRYGHSLLSFIDILVDKSHRSKTHDILLQNKTVSVLLDLLQISEHEDAGKIISLLRSVVSLHAGFVTAFTKGGLIFCIMLCLQGIYELKLIHMYTLL